MQTRSFLFQDKKIAYKVYGKGKPVILLHGFGEDSSVWEPQIKFLEPHFRLIVPDIPGSGESELVPGADIDRYAEILKELCEIELAKAAPVTAGEAKEKAVLIGHSMGGYITLAFAEKYPDYLASFGLFHSSAFADAAEKIATRKKAIDFINEKGAYTFIKTSTPNLFTDSFKEKQPGKVEKLIEAGEKFTAEALIQYYEAMIARPDRTAVLKTFPKPILFIIGEHDQAIPFEASMKQCHLPAQSHVHILRESAHMGMWEEEGKANEVLHSFINLDF
jgi:pimeloyl-ACP methyl ester carboxylesterase